MFTSKIAITPKMGVNSTSFWNQNTQIFTIKMIRNAKREKTY